MDFELTDEQLLLLEQVDKVCKDIRPSEDKCYVAREYNPYVREALARAHLFGLPVSPQYGDGMGADALTYSLVVERMGQEGIGVRTVLSAHCSLGEMLLQRWGTEEQKSRYLPPATKGDLMMAFALTEPSAGSDPSALQTTYQKDGPNYVLNGSKAWISNGSLAGLVTVFAKPKEGGKISAFLVDTKSPGYKAEPIQSKMGLPTADVSMVYLTDCSVPGENLLGPEGHGLSVAFSGLMNARLSVAAGSVGIMQDCLNEAVEYSKVRVQHGKPIGKHQLIQAHIAVIASNLEASRQLAYRAAWEKGKYDSTGDLGARERADLMITHAKYFGTKCASDAADRAVQVFGANGYSLLNRPARHLTDTRVTRIYEGADEILQLKIARSYLGQGFDAFS
jgi:alkylation response protein AidB-like acyl-CoA dehydrogenase